MSETVVVTGGAGFIGSNLVRELLRRGYRVKVIDNLSTGTLENLHEIRNDIEFVEADIRDVEVLHKHFRGIDVVLHQAALGSVPRSIDNPVDTHNVNINGTFNVFLAARDAGIKKVVYASSSSIYGNRKRFGSIDNVQHKREVMKPMPLSPYAATKLVGEEYAKVFAHIYELSTVCLRYFNVFGPRQNPASQYAAAIPKFITAILDDQPPTVFGDGKQSRDFTYVDNVVEANILAISSNRAVEGETINIACGHSVAVLEVIERINSILGKHIQPSFLPARKGEVRNSLASIEKAAAMIGYFPQVQFSQGLERTVRWFRDHGQTHLAALERAAASKA